MKKEKNKIKFKTGDVNEIVKVIILNFRFQNFVLGILSIICYFNFNNFIWLSFINTYNLILMNYECLYLN